MNRSQFYTVIVVLTIIWCKTVFSIDLPESMYISEDGTRLLQKINTMTGLYDETIVRTIYLEFKQENWWEQLENNYDSKVDILADLIMDDTTYPDVGVRFKGCTSYSMTGDSRKKSFNISIDYTDSSQRLMGYKTLNLNNCFNDASFMREVLYFNICRNYCPCPMANFVKLIINSEKWGIYANVQQINTDFIEEWFLSNDGDRWKTDMDVMGNTQQPTTWRKTVEGQLPADRHNPGQQNPGGGGTQFASGEKALTWLGSDVTAYEQAYELKAANTSDPWNNLITICDVLNNTSLEELADTLETVLAVDRCLWFLAVENIFTDDDSYLTKGADYQIYYEVESGRIHPLQYDGNEAICSRSVSLSPIEGENNENRPLISRLLSVPHLRQRYLAHMRTIIDESLDWNVLAPKIESYRNLIEEEVKADTKKLTSNTDFDNSITEFKNFVNNRRNYLLSYLEINRQVPVIVSVEHSTLLSGNDSPTTEDSVQVTAKMGGGVEIEEVILYYAEGLVAPFSQIIMFDDGAHGDGDAGDGLYGSVIPPHSTGSLVRYYVEARAADTHGTSAFMPVGAEHDVFFYEVSAIIADSTPVLINEIMAGNKTTIQDPQGDYEDWVELLNVSNKVVNLSGMYLTDSENNLKKWTIPDGTIMAPKEYLIVWADDDEDDEPGLHANFKLSLEGESILLVDTDDNNNAILDLMAFGEQESDISFGRYPDGSGICMALSYPTPAESNESQTSVSESNLPQNFNLTQNFPNPFNNTTVIIFSLPETTEIDLGVYNTLGQNVATLRHGIHQSGSYHVYWNGRDRDGNDLASGIYLYRLNAGIDTMTKSLLLLR
ncbi:MAG: CotH kinase family protein [Candidatus Latescibacteria bacterium]|nr:CotH kinase family protein [Candidatus Latescibacterota bacterium]